MPINMRMIEAQADDWVKGYLNYKRELPQAAKPKQESKEKGDTNEKPISSTKRTVPSRSN